MGFKALLILSLLFIFTSCSKDELKIRLLATTDLHTNVLDYDYYKAKSDVSFGFVRTASLIRSLRAETPNTFLMDNGDILQGTPLGDYIARGREWRAGDVHPVYKALNAMNYDVGNLGNHEFNFGIPFMKKAVNSANFPYLSSNIFIKGSNKTLLNEYLLKEKIYKTKSGKSIKIKVGVIGCAPPQIMMWDRSNVVDKIEVRGIIDTIKRVEPILRAKGADIVIALLHSGVSEKSNSTENVILEVTKLKGIDAIVGGHTHTIKEELINGIPVVIPGQWGSHVGAIDLTLKRVGNSWRVIEAKVKAHPISRRDGKKKIPLVEQDKEILKIVESDHLATLKYLEKRVGTIKSPINSFFAMVQDDSSVQITSNAQKWFVRSIIKGTEFEKFPLLSASAPFKNGGKYGPENYTDIPKGEITLKNVADLYVYPNTIKVVKIDGENVKEWLERSASTFNKIDPKSTKVQPLRNMKFRSYNFDILDGVTYRIDVRQPPRYNKGGELVNPKSHRITDLKYRGKPVTKTQQFLVATNNYRAGGGGHFPKLDGSSIVIDAPQANRQAIADYFQRGKEIDPTPDRNWSFKSFKNRGKVTILTSPKAKKFLRKGGPFTVVGTTNDGYLELSIDFSKF